MPRRAALVSFIGLLIGLVGGSLRHDALAEEAELVLRLAHAPDAIVRDAEGRPLAAFGLNATDARMLLFPISRWRAAPVGFQPPDLVYSAGRPIRSVVLGDYRMMTVDAAAEFVDLAIVSGYRSPAEQAAAFEASVRRSLARAESPIDRAEAEARASRFVAPPGHSQHQLGTAIDVSTVEIGYSIQPHLADTAAGRWVALHAWEYGFVLPYTRQGEARSGYAFEPWHLRWVGRVLAAFLNTQRYLDDPMFVVDDYLLAIEQILDAEAIP